MVRIIAVVALALLVGGCESEAPEDAPGVDAEVAVIAVDCGTAAQPDAEVAAPEADASVQGSVVYAVSFVRTSDAEAGSCGFDFDHFIDRLAIAGPLGSWYADGVSWVDGATAAVTRSGGSFMVSAAADTALGDVRYTMGPCAAAVAADGSWWCEMERRLIDADDSVRCFNRYAVAGVPL